MKCKICSKDYERAGYLLWCSTCQYGTSALPIHNTRGLTFGLDIAKEETSKEFGSKWMPKWESAIRKVPKELLGSLWLVPGAGPGIIINILRSIGVKGAVGYEPRKNIFGQAQKMFHTADLLIDVPSMTLDFDVILFWNCFLEIEGLDRLIALYSPKFVLFDIPVFVGRVGDIFGWKYYLPGEIQYYFTPNGVSNYMKWLGYEVKTVLAGEPAIIVAKKL